MVTPKRRLLRDEGICAPRIPLVNEERAVLQQVQSQLDELHSLVQRFVDGLLLIQLCESTIEDARLVNERGREPFTPISPDNIEAGVRSRRAYFEASQKSMAVQDMWQAFQRMGIRDAVMAVKDIHETLVGLCRSRKNSKTLSVLIDDAEIGAVIARFCKYFPDYDLARHGFAHPADAVNKPEQETVTGIQASVPFINAQPTSRTIMSGLLVDGVAIVTRDRKVAKCDLTDVAVDRLCEIVKLIGAIFERASDSIRRGRSGSEGEAKA